MCPFMKSLPFLVSAFVRRMECILWARFFFTLKCIEIRIRKLNGFIVEIR